MTTISQAADFDFLSRLVHERSAIVLEPGKEYLVETRLSPLARDEGLEDIRGLVATLRRGGANGLVEKVVEAMTTNETSFFRDQKPFEALRNLILPDLLKRRAEKRTLSIWSGASSSGQEAYSTAITIREHFPQLESWNIRILGTDLSNEMVTKAAKGSYSQLEINRGLPAPLMIKYFERDGSLWKVKPQIRTMVEFRQMNLTGSWAAVPTMDVIFLRNVLIYFDVDTKKRIFGEVKRKMTPDGYLVLGAAETPLSLDPDFVRVKAESGGYYQVGGAH